MKRLRNKQVYFIIKMGRGGEGGGGGGVTG